MDSTPRILVADDEESIRKSIGEFLFSQGFEVSLAQNATEGLEILRHRKFDLLISDIHMPGNENLDFIRSVTQLYPEMLAIIITAFPSLPTAVKSLRLRVLDYIPKPVQFDVLLKVINKAFEKNKVLECVRRFRNDSAQLEEQLAGMEEVFSMRRDVSEPGGGKPSSAQMLELMLSQLVRSTLNLRLAYDMVGARNEVKSPEVSGPFCKSIQCPVRMSNEKMLQEAVEVLERTKNSFKSKELADLRKQIESHLRSQG